MKKLSILLLFLSFFVLSKSEDFIYGLKFNSSEHLITERTSLALFPVEKKSFSNKFTLSFSFRMYDIKYGYILRIVDGSTEYSLNCIPFRNDENCYLDFYINNNKTGQLAMPKSLLQKGQQSTFKISFDLTEKEVVLSVFEQTATFYIEELPKKMAPGFYFGLYGVNLDVAPFSIKDIKIFNAKEKLVNFWPLNEKSGDESLDIIENEKAEIKNPNWIAKSHFYWNNLKNFKVETDADMSFDKLRNEVLIVGKDSLIKYCLTDSSTTVIRYKNSNPVINVGFNVIYNNNKRRLESYTPGISEDKSKIPIYSSYNEKLNTWNAPDSATTESLLWHHQAFFIKNGTNLGLFGGYGNYQYHNDFLVYNKKKQDWDTLSLKGDSLNPRFFSAIGADDSDSIIYLFGGFGNLSGHQENGGYNMYDLYKINTKTLTCEKLFELQPHTIHFVPTLNLIVDKPEHCIYSLMYPHHQPNTFIALIKIDLEKQCYKIISDSIPVKSERIKTHAKFYQTINKKYFVTLVKELDELKDFAHIGIYTLDAPPIEDISSQYSLNTKTNNNLPFWIILISSGLVVFIIVIYFFYFKSDLKTPEELDSLEGHEDESRSAHQPTQHPNSIFLFGDFLVIDKRGKNICHLFPPKIQQALILLIIESASGNKGISSNNFSKTLWPDKDPEQLKNIRGVTLNHLRNSIEDIDGIKVIYNEEKMWYVDCDSNFYCDYFELTNLIDSEKLSNAERLNSLMPILKRGVFLPDLHDPYIDFHKNNLENQIIDLSVEVGEEYYANHKYAQTNDIMRIIRSFSYLNESVLSLRVKALMKLGKVRQAKNYFHHFCMEYKKAMDMDYDKRFKELF